MKDKELRKLIGSRAKQRRLELNLTQPYVAEKMGVTASTILRYENGSHSFCRYYAILSGV